MSKLNKLEQDKKEVLDALKGINPKAHDEFVRKQALEDLAKAEAELRELKTKKAKEYVKEDFVPNENPKSKHLNPAEQRTNSFFKRLARFEHYNNK